MTSFQDSIDKQLKIIEEGHEIIDSDDFFLICEADYYRPPGEKWYSKHRDLTGAGSKIGAGVSSVLTVGIYGWFRKITNACRQNCREIEGRRKEKCIAICNMNAAKRTIDRINSDKSKLLRIKDSEKRRKAKNLIDKEKDKWLIRYDKYKTQVATLSATVTQMKTKKK